MELCVRCQKEPIRYPKTGLCKKCYAKDYNKTYYKNNQSKIKQQTAAYYYENHEKSLEDRKAYREKIHFDSQRMRVLERDGFCCQTCNQHFDESKLIVHHKDRNGRGSENPNNADENLITQCRRCHAAEHREELQLAKEMKLKGQWSHRYLSCIECGTTERKHNGKGLCVNCAARKRRKQG